MINAKRGHIFITRILLFFFLGAAVCACIIAVLKPFSGYLEPVFSGICEQGFTHSTAIELQISVSFIVVSLITVFSQKSKIIYWEDVFEYKLIIPMLTNFNAIVSYIFATLLCSIVLIVLNSGYVYISFLLSLFWIIFLSLKMLSALFSDNLIRRELETEFIKIKKLRKENTAYREKYRRIKMRLMEFTIQFIEGNEIKSVCDNLGFLYRMEEYGDAKYLVDKIVEAHKYYLLSRIVKENRYALVNEPVFQYYREVCLELVNDDDFADTQYISSIVKSFAECAGQNSESEQADKLEKAFQGFAEELIGACIRHERTSLKEKIKQICMKRQDWEYE